jgi:O-antigen/teichoic acid export membrane protein
MAEPTTTTPLGQASIGRNIAAMASGQVVTWSMTLAWTLVVPRLLGPAGMGLIVTAWAVTGLLATVLGFGTRNYLVRAIVVAPGDAGQLIATGTVLRLLLAPVFMLAVAIWAHFADYGPEGTLALYLAGGATVFTLLAEPIQAGFQAIERMKYLAYSDVINKSVQGLLGIALAVAGFGAVGFTGCWLVMSAVVLVLDVVWLRRHVRVQWRTTPPRLAHMARESMSYWAFGVFFMLYLWIDSAMLSVMTSATVVGWYGVSTKLFQTLMVVPVLISTAWLPRLVSVYERSPSELQRAARAPVEIVLVLGLPIADGIALVAGPAIDRIYGPAYDGAVPVMVLLGLCVPFMYLNIILSQVLIAAKRQFVWTWVMLGATVVNPVINLFLIPQTQSRFDNGAIGAAVSLLVTEIFIVAAGLALAGRGVVGLRALRRLTRTAAASAAMLGVGFATHGLGTAPSVTAGLLAFLVLAKLLHLATPEEIEAIRGRLAPRLRSARRPAARKRAGTDRGTAPAES